MPPDSAASVARRRAILFVLASSGSFAVASALVKAVGPGLPVIEIMLFRNVVAFLCLLPLVHRAGGWSVLRTRRPLGHLGRTLAGLGGMFSTFYGLAYLPIAATTALGFAMPLVLALISVPLLNERLTGARLVTIFAGLAGVLLVVRPWQGTSGLPLGPTSVVLVGVVAWALGMVSIRRMGQAGERNITIVTLFALSCSVISLLACIPVWVTPALVQWPILIGVGVVSAAAQLLMTEGYRSGEASMLAPFEYSAIFYTTALGWLFWGETLGAWEATGIAVLILSGLFTWWREGRS